MKDDSEQKILVSACLAGEACRYNGTSKPCQGVIELIKNGKAIPVCPELLAGLLIPRSPAEQKGDRVYTKDGEDVTEEYRKGAELVLTIAKENGCKKAILKSKSPSCGSGVVYDGSFSGSLIKGDGVLVKLLKENDIEVISEKEL